MKKFRVTWIQEVAQVWCVDIDANSKEEAIEKVESDNYLDENILEDILDEKLCSRDSFEAEEIN